jgi:hypothetical protein
MSLMVEKVQIMCNHGLKQKCTFESKSSCKYI